MVTRVFTIAISTSLAYISLTSTISAKSEGFWIQMETQINSDIEHTLSVTNRLGAVRIAPQVIEEQNGKTNTRLVQPLVISPLEKGTPTMSCLLVERLNSFPL
jgi:hypothetical protein